MMLIILIVPLEEPSQVLGARVIALNAPLEVSPSLCSVIKYSSIGNLIDDVKNRKIDFIVHLGDLAYNMAMNNGSRGDGYMLAFQPVLSKIPW